MNYLLQIAAAKARKEAQEAARVDGGSPGDGPGMGMGDGMGPMPAAGGLGLNVTKDGGALDGAFAAFLAKEHYEMALRRKHALIKEQKAEFQRKRKEALKAAVWLGEMREFKAYVKDLEEQTESPREDAKSPGSPDQIKVKTLLEQIDEIIRRQMLGSTAKKKRRQKLPKEKQRALQPKKGADGKLEDEKITRAREKMHECKVHECEKTGGRKNHIYRTFSPNPIPSSQG